MKPDVIHPKSLRRRLRQLDVEISQKLRDELVYFHKRNLIQLATPLSNIRLHLQDCSRRDTYIDTDARSFT